MDGLKTGGIAVIDYGSQTTQLIARRIRELGVYSEVFPHDAPPERINAHQPAGYILSGGPGSVYERGAPRLPNQLLEGGKPILGICYGMQLLTDALGGRVAASVAREYGPAQIQGLGETRLFDGMESAQTVWMSHGDRIEALPPGFAALAQSDNSPYAAIGDVSRHIYGLQFHPEVRHSRQGTAMLRNFALDICGCQAKWSARAFIDDALRRIREQVGSQRVLLALSGGVDSAVAGALIQRAIGERLTCIFVDHGLLRQDEAAQVLRVFREERGMRLIAVNACRRVPQRRWRASPSRKPSAKSSARNSSMFSAARRVSCAASAFWRKAPSTPMSSKAREMANLPRRSSRITMSAACRRIWISSW